jgi:acyl carrier protein
VTSHLDEGNVPLVAADSVETLAALRSMPDVVDALVTQRPGPGGAPVTTGYVTGPDPVTDPAQIRKVLQSSLPDYLVPHQIVVLTQLPLTPEGGYDLAALPEPQARPAPTGPYVAPRTPMERRLAEAVAELLGVPRVGVGDSFFALGGSSLRAFQLTTQIDEMFGAQLLLRDVFAAPTVEEMTQLIVQANRGRAGIARERMRRRWRLTMAESERRWRNVHGKMPLPMRRLIWPGVPCGATPPGADGDAVLEVEGEH